MTSHTPPQPIGRRVAEQRQQNGWTQQVLAEQLAISRVAVSHIELGFTIPSERTVTLLASLFKCAPHKLVAGTNYPRAKADRLPYTVAWYSPLEMDLKLLENDLDWLEKIDAPHLKDEIYLKWMPRLGKWETQILNEPDRQKLTAALEKIKSAGARAVDAVK